jgi:hypothetical protein
LGTATHCNPIIPLSLLCFALTVMINIIINIIINNNNNIRTTAWPYSTRARTFPSRSVRTIEKYQAPHAPHTPHAPHARTVLTPEDGWWVGEVQGTIRSISTRAG